MRALTAWLLLTMSTACERSGKLVVVLDTTMRGEGVEVVAFRSDDGASDRMSRRTGSGAARGRPATPLDDSAAMLANRFRDMRDSLNAEVARLDSVDRRSRAYAVRYAEIRRRTVAAEQLRARRDSVQARASALRVDAPSTSSSPHAGGESLPAIDRMPGVQRHAVNDSTVALELAEGRWSIAAVRDGRLVSEITTIAVVSGESDTVRITASARRGDTP